MNVNLQGNELTNSLMENNQNILKENNQNTVKENTNKIIQLEKSVVEVSELFTSISLLVNYQGEQLDNIENNIANSNNYIEKSNNQLIKASKYKNKKNKCIITLLCTGFLFITITIVIIIYTH